MDSDERRRRRKNRSASGEVDEPINPPEATIFKAVEEGTAASMPEFEPVHPGEPHVEWDDVDNGDVGEIVEERFEAILEDLFTDWDDEDLAIFEDVRDSVGWSKGDVIWEGMDFDQMFTDPGEFHDFELLSRKDKRAFLHERLKTQQASVTADAGESELDLPLEPKRSLKAARKARKAGPKPQRGGPLVSYETETEHRAQDLDIGMAPGKGRRRKVRD